MRRYKVQYNPRDFSPCEDNFTASRLEWEAGDIFFYNPDGTIKLIVADGSWRTVSDQGAA